MGDFKVKAGPKNVGKTTFGNGNGRYQLENFAERNKL